MSPKGMVLIIPGRPDFGAKHDFFEQDLRGKNTYINPPFNTFDGGQNLIEKVISKYSTPYDQISPDSHF